MSAKYMSNIKSIGALARLYCFVEICWNLHPFSELKNVFFANFRTFLKFSKCKALGDFLISFLERVPLKGCLGGISQNWNFWNWFEIRDIFRHWLLRLVFTIDGVGVVIGSLWSSENSVPIPLTTPSPTFRLYDLVQTRCSRSRKQKQKN